MLKSFNTILLFLILISCPLSGQSIYINELMSKNEDIIDDNGEQEDWIELYNASDNTVNLGSWSLSDDLEEPNKYVFPDSINIPPGGFLLLWADKEEGTHHLPFKLSANGESLALFRIEGNDFVLVDMVSFPNLSPNISYGRSIDGAGVWQKYTIYSPNNSNANNQVYSAATVTFSLAAGFYNSGTFLHLQTTAPASEIRYTTDGTRPTANSLLYSSPLILDNSVLISAAVIGENGDLGIASNRFYHIDNQHDIPIVHLQTEATNLWDNQKGIYVIGINGISGNCVLENRNWNQEWKRKAQCSFFEPDGSLAFSEPVSIEISGACSRKQRMKSFNVKLEDGKTTEYPIFPQLDFTNYRSFKLRNSGSDFTQTMLRDGALQEVLRDRIDLDLMAYRPVILYLNGAYFGVYNLREIMNEDYIEQHYGEQEIDMIRNPWIEDLEVKEGDVIDCNALNDWVIENDLTIAENYAFFQKNVDVNQMINYWATEMYIANYDWPGNNMMMWRKREDSNAKWRFMLFDLDLSTDYFGDTRASSSFNSLNHAITAEENIWANPPSTTLWLGKLSQNPSFLHELAQRQLSFGQLVFTAERMQFMTDSLTDIIRPEISRHIDFWNDAPNNWYTGLRIPCGGNYESWEEYLGRFSLFFEERFPFVIQHYKEKFDFAGTYQLHLNYNENTNGKIVLHKNKMQTPYDYKGQYFKNIPLHVEAIAEPGYVFVRWEELSTKEAIVSYIGIKDQRLTPIFRKESDILKIEDGFQWKIYPSLASDILHIEAALSTPSVVKVEIISAIGQIVFEENIEIYNYAEVYSFDISSIAEGVYFLRLNTDNEGVTAKFIVQR